MLRKSKTCWNIKNRKKTFKNTRKNINNMKKIWMKILPRRKSKKNITITQQNMKNRKNMKNTYTWVEVGGWGNPSCTGCTHWNRKMPGLTLSLHYKYFYFCWIMQFAHGCKGIYYWRHNYDQFIELSNVSSSTGFCVVPTLPQPFLSFQLPMKQTVYHVIKVREFLTVLKEYTQSFEYCVNLPSVSKNAPRFY